MASVFVIYITREWNCKKNFVLSRTGSNYVVKYEVFFKNYSDLSGLCRM